MARRGRRIRFGCNWIRTVYPFRSGSNTCTIEACPPPRSRSPGTAGSRQLWARTAAVAGRLNRAQAELVDIAAELISDRHWGDGGFKTPEHYLVVRAGLSPAHAKDVVAVARRRAELVDASSALDAGELSLDQVAVIAHGVPTGYLASVTAFAREATVPQLRRAVSRHAFPARARGRSHRQ